MINIILLSDDKRIISKAIEFANYMAPKSKINSITIGKNSKKSSIYIKLKKLLKKSSSKSKLLLLIDQNTESIDVERIKGFKSSNNAIVLVCSLVESTSIAALKSQQDCTLEEIVEEIVKVKISV